MDHHLIEQLLPMTDTEQAALATQSTAEGNTSPAFANMPLRRKDYIWNVGGTGFPVRVKLHTRFVDIPLHSHGYIEMMYVAKGSVKHWIDGTPVTLHQGELLLMNCHVAHSIEASGAQDIGVNFIISKDFFRFGGHRFRNSKALQAFEAGNREGGHSQYLVFQVNQNLSMQNLIENLIQSTLFDIRVPEVILADTLSLLFRYLEMFPEVLVCSGADTDRTPTHKTQITDYIQTNYRTPSLSELAEQLGMTPPYVSKRIHTLFGMSFRNLVREKRLDAAEQMLLETDLSVNDIAEAVGYENNSFFHKIFQEQYHQSPAKWRKAMRSKEGV